MTDAKTLHAKSAIRTFIAKLDGQMDSMMKVDTVFAIARKTKLPDNHIGQFLAASLKLSPKTVNNYAVTAVLYLLVSERAYGESEAVTPFIAQFLEHNGFKYLLQTLLGNKNKSSNHLVTSLGFKLISLMLVPTITSKYVLRCKKHKPEIYALFDDMLTFVIKTYAATDLSSLKYLHHSAGGVILNLTTGDVKMLKLLIKTPHLLDVIYFWAYPPEAAKILRTVDFGAQAFMILANMGIKTNKILRPQTLNICFEAIIAYYTRQMFVEYATDILEDRMASQPIATRFWESTSLTAFLAEEKYEPTIPELCGKRETYQVPAELVVPSKPHPKIHDLMEKNSPAVWVVALTKHHNIKISSAARRTVIVAIKAVPTLPECITAFSEAAQILTIANDVEQAAQQLCITMRWNQLVSSSEDKKDSLYGVIKDVLDDDVLHCAQCGTLSKEKLKVCSGCNLFAYCNAKCQLIHWKSGHKFVCKRT